MIAIILLQILHSTHEILSIRETAATMCKHELASLTLLTLDFDFNIVNFWEQWFFLFTKEHRDNYSRGHQGQIHFHPFVTHLGKLIDHCGQTKSVRDCIRLFIYFNSKAQLLGWNQDCRPEYWTHSSWRWSHLSLWPSHSAVWFEWLVCAASRGW